MDHGTNSHPLGSLISLVNKDVPPLFSDEGKQSLLSAAGYHCLMQINSTPLGFRTLRNHGSLEQGAVTNFFRCILKAGELGY